MKRSREYTETLRLMGRSVEVHKKMERVVDDQSRVTWIAVDIEPRAGWVVGMRWKKIGTIESNYRYNPHSLDPPEDADPVFSQTGSIPVLMVCPWITENPLLVPFDGFRLADNDTTPHPAGRKKQLTQTSLDIRYAI